MLNLIAASSGGVPALDMRPSCRAAAIAQTTIPDKMQVCMAIELRAHDRLVKNWERFTIAQRASCLRAMTNFEPNYTEN